MNELEIVAFRCIQFFRGKESIDGHLILESIEKLREHFSVKMAFGNEVNFEVTDDVFGKSFQQKVVPLQDSQTDTFRLSVYAKERNESADYRKIGCFATNIYDLKLKTPLIIQESLRVPAFDQKTSIGGKMTIKCSSDIIISAEGGITATVTKQQNKALNAQERRETVVGLICVLCDYTITIKGDICCNAATGGVRREDTAVCISAVSSVSNHGTIRCENNTGSVRIICGEFENEGTIYPEPNIMIKQHGISKMEKTTIWSDSEQMIPLSVYDHRGHSSNYHPNNLLVDNTNSYYRSNYSLKPIGDWIIFKLNTNRIMKPSSISIRNSIYDYGIKSISLWMGRDDGYWTKMAEDIKGIHQNNKDPQKFALSLLVSDDELIKNGYDLFMMEVLGNWGHSQNMFYSFQLNGFAFVDEDIQ